MANDKFSGVEVPLKTSAAALGARIKGISPAPAGITEGKQYFPKKKHGPEKGTMMTIRTKPEVKEEFDRIRKFFGYSQSEFLEALLLLGKEQAKKEGWTGM